MSWHPNSIRRYHKVGPGGFGMVLNFESWKSAPCNPLLLTLMISSHTCPSGSFSYTPARTFSYFGKQAISTPSRDYNFLFRLCWSLSIGLIWRPWVAAEQNKHHPESKMLQVWSFTSLPNRARHFLWPGDDSDSASSLGSGRSGILDSQAYHSGVLNSDLR